MPDLTITAAKRAILELQDELVERLGKFQADTSLVVDSINIERVNIGTSEKPGETCIGAVIVNTRLEP